MNLGGDLHCSQEGSEEPPFSDSEVPAWKAAHLKLRPMAGVLLAPSTLGPLP